MPGSACAQICTDQITLQWSPANSVIGFTNLYRSLDCMVWNLYHDMVSIILIAIKTTKIPNNGIVQYTNTYTATWLGRYSVYTYLLSDMVYRRRSKSRASKCIYLRRKRALRVLHLSLHRWPCRHVTSRTSRHVPHVTFRTSRNVQCHNVWGKSAWGTAATRGQYQ